MRACVALALGMAALASPAMAGAATAGGSGGSTPGRQGPVVTEPFLASATVDDTRPRRTVPPSYPGFSVEYWTVPLWTGDFPAPLNGILVRLLRDLGAYGNGPPQVRVGGNSGDQSWWNPEGRPRPDSRIQFDVTPAWMARTAAVVRRTGSPLVLGLNLAQNNPAFGKDLARAALFSLPRGSIESFEIGNEPDLFPRRAFAARAPGYSFPRYLQEFHRYVSAVRGAARPSPAVTGPAFGTQPWVRNHFSRFLQLEAGTLNQVTLHQYPLSVCGKEPGDPNYPDITGLLSPASSTGLATESATQFVQARAHGITARMGEIGSASCGGADGVSNTFASALWGTDVMFELATRGASGVNFHAGTGGFYNPVDFLYDGRRWLSRVNPLYYGMLLFAQATANQARFVPVSTSTAANVKVWAAVDLANTLRVVVLNKDRTAGGRVAIRIPGARGTGELVRLEAPSVDAKTGVTLAGQTFGDVSTDGRLHGLRSAATVTPRKGTWNLSVPPTTGVMLTIPTATPTVAGRQRGR